MSRRNLFHIIFTRDLAVSIVKVPDATVTKGIAVELEDDSIVMTSWTIENGSRHDFRTEQLTDKTDFYLHPRALVEIGQIMGTKGSKIKGPIKLGKFLEMVLK